MATDAKAIRRYHAGIERALGLFDSTSEWADFIAYLSRLHKALQDPPGPTDLPSKTTIARHLAQCLRPSLPAGVHQKALDVYALIFSIIGPVTLAHDLPLYLPGLSHTLAFASLATRPQFLSIYDDYILPLPADKIRPALKAIVLSLLPGLEEETSEDFERTLATFNKLRTKFKEAEHEELFWQNLFLASTTSATRRAGVLVYLTRYLPKLGEDATSNLHNGTESNGDAVEPVKPDIVLQPEPGLLVRCFATGLQDDQPLIQRGFLDLLVSRLPLHVYIFASGDHDSDLDVLVSAAIMVVLRRDMSLNRRLWTWFTATDPKVSSAAEKDTENELLDTSQTTQQRSDSRSMSYFKRHGLQSLIRSILAMVSATSDRAASKAQPFRIALSLMDRWEIGGPIVEAVFIPLIRMLELYQSNAPSQEAFDEVFRSANVFFDGIEGRLIASQMLRLLRQGELDLILFLVTNFNLEDDEMMRRHTPLICLFVARRLHEEVVQKPANLADAEPHENATKLARILDELTRVTAHGIFVDTEDTPDPGLWQQWPSHVLRFYEQISGATKSIMLPLPRSTLTAILMQMLCDTCIYCFQASECKLSLLTLVSSIMERMLSMVRGCATLRRTKFPTDLLSCLADVDDDERRQFELSTCAARILTSIRQDDDETTTALTPDTWFRSIPHLIGHLWTLLKAATPQYHVEVVENIWRLHRNSRDIKLVESTISSLIIDGLSSNSSSVENAARLGTFWTHSRTVGRQIMGPKFLQNLRSGEEAIEIIHHPLLLLVDCDERSNVEHPIAIWARSSSSLLPALRIVLSAATNALSDQQVMSLTLRRVDHLVEIARETPNLWKSFTEQHEQSGAVLEFCSSIISKELFASSLGVQALGIIQRITKAGNFPLESDFVNLLVTQLSLCHDNTDLQSALLDALQNMTSTTGSASISDTMLPVLLEGIASLQIDSQLEKWIGLLCNVVSLLVPTTLMTSLLKITETLCTRTENYFILVQRLYGSPVDGLNSPEIPASSAMNPERSIASLLSGMEYVLARAHRQASLPWDKSTAASAVATTPATPDLPSARSSANDQLTVVLCLQDALRQCAKLWLWRASGRSTSGPVDVKSIHYMSSKFRARSRRILENLIEAEPQECLETLMGLWVDRRLQSGQHGQILELLQTLDGARPKFMMPATFNAIYNRSNPAALDVSQRSSLSINVNSLDLIAFLNDYTAALEDDLLDEIWTDCTTFLKEILANPLPHRQILLSLLEFAAVLCRKMENTNFGEEARMRKELADLCARLFAAIFTIKPYGIDVFGTKLSNIETVLSWKPTATLSSSDPGNALQVLHETLPDLSMVLNQSDRLTSVYTGIATNMTGPLLRSKQYPLNVSPELLTLLQTISQAPSATRAWKKDVQDAFNDPKFFQHPVELIERGWLPLIRQLALQDKTTMPELLNRLIPPAAAGIMFGVGATAARTEADRKTQLTLRRICVFLLAMEPDFFVPHLPLLFIKLEELLIATPESSPSSLTRSDVYMLLRTVLLSFSHSQLSTLWPMLDMELHDLCTDMLDTTSPAQSRFNMAAKAQGAKLLDLLLLIKPDEFQLREWLFVTDTVDAIYPAYDIEPVALADRVGSTLTGSDAVSGETPKTPLPGQLGARKPWLAVDASRDPDRLATLLAGFFSHLSIRAFEDNYSLQKTDVPACRKDLIADLFVDV